MKTVAPGTGADWAAATLGTAWTVGTGPPGTLLSFEVAWAWLCCETKDTAAAGVAPGTKDDCVATELADMLRAGEAGRAGANDAGEAGRKAGVGPTGFTADVAADDWPEREDGRGGGAW